mgnify:CR=1 FL=1
MWKIKNKRWKRKPHPVSVRTEIIGIFLIFTLIIMGVFLAIYSQNMAELRQATQDHLTESSRQMAETANSIIMDMGPLFRIPYEDSRLRNILSGNRKDYEERVRFENTTYVESAIAHAISDNEYIIRGCFFTAGGDVYSNISSVFGDYKEYVYSIIAGGGIGENIYYTEPRTWSIGLVERRVVTAIKVLYNYNGVTPLAWLVMDINYEKLEELLVSTDGLTGTMLLCNGFPIYRNSLKDLSKEQEELIRIKSLSMAEQGLQQDVTHMGRKNYLTTAIKSIYTGWVLVRYMDEQEAVHEISRRQAKDITILFLTAVIVFLIYYCRISRMMEPLSLMDRVIRRNKGDCLEKVYLPGNAVGRAGDNEILNVVRNYNAMVERLNEYTEKILRYEIRQKEAQIKMLTYQINPHFLYNTLNTISAMAEIENMNQIVEITESISNIFRYNLKGESEVKLGEELEHVKDYVRIQTYRFPRRFKVSYDIPEELEEIKVMKFILQPIVENCISHGFCNMVRDGKIIVSARLEAEGDMIVLTVDDNGEGINKKRLEEINNKLFLSRMDRENEEFIGADGIGIMNVNARIAAYYGGECGIIVQSVYGKGTQTVLRLKRQE